ncbi:hypothetical protein STA3757_03970 [Stanieria sp. NIES-3757]|nr:hypothetical protein STA3757_03970 [Stanieria sp. NIES-3757]
MNDFLHLPGYGEYLSRWINLSSVETIIKMSEDKVQIIYATNRREMLSGIWARVILAYLGETEYQEMLANTKYFDEV